MAQSYPSNTGTAGIDSVRMNLTGRSDLSKVKELGSSLSTLIGLFVTGSNSRTQAKKSVDQGLDSNFSSRVDSCYWFIRASNHVLPLPTYIIYHWEFSRSNWRYVPMARLILNKWLINYAKGINVSKCNINQKKTFVTNWWINIIYLLFNVSR